MKVQYYKLQPLRAIDKEQFYCYISNDLHPYTNKIVRLKKGQPYYRLRLEKEKFDCICSQFLPKKMEVFEFKN